MAPFSGASAPGTRLEVLGPMHTSPVSISIALTNQVLSAEIADARPDVVELFGPLDEDQRLSLAGDAWAIGLRSMMNAYRYSQESRLAEIGKSLLEDVDAGLKEHVKRQQEVLLEGLQRYFDPKDGQFVLRVDDFLKDGGSLSQAMSKFLEPESGALATTLAKSVGENSPLLRKLSPTDSEGIISLIETRMARALDENRTAVAKALDPLAPDGAVARFLKSLRQDLEKADGERSKQLALATKALDANDEQSLLSRLVRETQAARRTMLEAMNPEAPGSALAILKTALTAMLEKHAKSQAEVMEAFDERQKRLDQEIRGVVARLEARKRADATSPRGGRTFEEKVRAFTHEVLTGAPVFVEDTGATVGARAACKVGDQVVRFNPESIYAGATIVIEAKRENGYTVARALAELEVARSNRVAQAGVFVLSKGHAPVGFPGFSKAGNDVVVVWDEEDTSTDPYLQAAILLALGLATRQKRGENEGNISALADVEHKIEKELKRHEKMRDLAEVIQRKAEDLLDEIRKGGKGLQGLVKAAKATLKALDVELVNADEERSEPLSLAAHVQVTGVNPAAE